MNLKKEKPLTGQQTMTQEQNDINAENSELIIEDKKKTGKKKKPFNVRTLRKYFNQKTFLLIGLAGLAMLVIVYVFVFLEYTQRTEELEASNATLKSVVNELRVYYENMDNYKAEIKEIKAGIEEIMTEYPVDAREEDVIMLAVQLQNQNAIAYDTVNMSETEEVYTVPAENVKLADIEGFDALSFRKKKAVYVNTTNYDNLKTVIEQIFASDNRIGIDKIVYAKDEELGVLSGNIDLYFYSAAGTGKEYIAPEMTEYLAGTSDIFQSSKVKLVVVDDTAAEGEENGAD